MIMLHKSPTVQVRIVVALLFAKGVGHAATDTRVVEAMARKDTATVRVLIEQQADVNAAQADGATALAWAAHWNDLEAADLLLRAGADVNAANDYGVTPLALACVNGSAAMVDRLLKAGANANAAQATGETPIMTCARTGNADAVQHLIAHEANVNAAETWKSQTALMWAAADRHPEAVRLLLARGADVHARTKSGFTPLLFAAQQGNVETALLLIEAGSDVNEAAPDGMTPLLIAAASGHGPLAIFLLDHQADPNATSERGNTALHYAASGRNLLELTKALLARGANPNAQLTRGEVGATPFFLAAAAGNVPVMRTLLEGGADPRIPTKENTTALMVASGVGRFESRDEGGDKKALEAAKLALEAGVDVNAVGENQWTALHGAAYTGSDAIIQVLVDHGSKLDVKDVFGQTPLSIAEAVVTRGLGENADVRPRRWRESTVNLLLQLGATPTAQTGVEVVGSMAVRPSEQ
jgi:ankyrin repeat protein